MNTRSPISHYDTWDHAINNTEWTTVTAAHLEEHVERGQACNIDGVAIFVGAGRQDKYAAASLIKQCLDRTHPRLRRRLDRFYFSGYPSPANIVGPQYGVAGTAQPGTGDVCFWRGYVPAQWQFDHELAHLIGYLGGPPMSQWQAWEAAMIADEQWHERQQSLTVAFDHCYTALTGTLGVTTYARDGGIIEDWADSVSLWLGDIRHGYVSQRQWNRKRYTFADLYPARAHVLEAVLPRDYSPIETPRFSAE